MGADTHVIILIVLLLISFGAY
ncbi:type I toxin-antitoxin system Ibs family toxin [Escherichia coli]